MKVIILAHGRKLSLEETALSLPAEMLPILGRSVLQRRLESLADSGQKDWVVLLGPRALPVTDLVGDGTRWGAKVEYQTLGPGLEVMVVASSLAALLETEMVLDPLKPGGAGLSFLEQTESGFAGASDISSYYHTVLNALEGNIPGFVRPGHQISPGVYIAHQARVHRKAKLIPPVYIGRQADIGPDTIIGPMVAVEQEVLVGCGTQITHSVVQPMTVLGEGLDINESVVDGCAVFRPEWGSVYVARDRGLAFSLAKILKR